MTQQLLEQVEEGAKRVNPDDTELVISEAEINFVLSIINRAKANINPVKEDAIRQSQINKQEFIKFLSDFSEDQQIYILKTILSQFQINLEPSNKFRWFINNYLKINSIEIGSKSRSPEIIIDNVSDFWKEKDGYIFNWNNYLNKKHIFKIPDNTKDHEFMKMIQADSYNVDHKFIIHFLLFFIDYINEEATISDEQLIKINKSIKSSLSKYGRTTVAQIAEFEERFINYVISNRTNTGITPLEEQVIPPGYDRLLTIINPLHFKNRLNFIFKRLKKPEQNTLILALRQYVQLLDEEYNKDINLLLENPGGKKDSRNQIKEDLDAMRAQMRAQTGGNLTSNKLLYNVVTAYVMLHNSKNILRIKDIVSSSLQSTLTYKNGKIRNVKIPTINDIFKMIVLPIMCSNKGINVTYDKMVKCFNKKMHKLLSNKEVEKYIELFDLTDENKITLREYDRRVASIVKLL